MATNIRNRTDLPSSIVELVVPGDEPGKPKIAEFFLRVGEDGGFNFRPQSKQEKGPDGKWNKVVGSNGEDVPAHDFRVEASARSDGAATGVLNVFRLSRSGGAPENVGSLFPAQTKDRGWKFLDSSASVEMRLKMSRTEDRPVHDKAGFEEFAARMKERYSAVREAKKNAKESTMEASMSAFRQELEQCRKDGNFDKVNRRIGAGDWSEIQPMLVEMRRGELRGATAVELVENVEPAEAAERFKKIGGLLDAEGLEKFETEVSALKIEELSAALKEGVTQAKASLANIAAQEKVVEPAAEQKQEPRGRAENKGKDEECVLSCPDRAEGEPPKDNKDRQIEALQQQLKGMTDMQQKATLDGAYKEFGQQMAGAGGGLLAPLSTLVIESFKAGRDLLKGTANLTGKVAGATLAGGKSLVDTMGGGDGARAQRAVMEMRANTPPCEHAHMARARDDVASVIEQREAFRERFGPACEVVEKHGGIEAVNANPAAMEEFTKKVEECGGMDAYCKDVERIEAAQSRATSSLNKVKHQTEDFAQKNSDCTELRDAKDEVESLADKLDDGKELPKPVQDEEGKTRLEDAQKKMMEFIKKVLESIKSLFSRKEAAPG